MKDRKQRRKVIPRCYRPNLSRTLSNSSLSQLVHIASYKKLVNDLKRNNRELAEALTQSRVEAAIQSKILTSHAQDSNNILFARLKLNEMAKNVAKFVTDLEEVRSYLNVDFINDNNLCIQRKRSPSGKITRRPGVESIEEVSEFSSENENAAEKIPGTLETNAVLMESPPDLVESLPGPSNLSHNKKSNVPLHNPEFDMDCENDEVASILFTSDTEEKKTSSGSTRRTRSSRRFNVTSNGLQKGSLTPELDVLTCVKEKRNSSRRLTQFVFPEISSKSRSKTVSSGKKNSSEELVTPVRPESPPLLHRKEVYAEAVGTDKTNFKGSFIENVNKKKNQSNSPEEHKNKYLEENMDHNNYSSVPVAHVRKGAPVIEYNHTLISCEDMELTEVVNPAERIAVENGLPMEVKPADDSETESANSEQSELVAKEKVSDAASLSENPQSAVLPDNDVHLPEISEHDEVQNAGTDAICDKNNIVMDDENFNPVSPNIKRSRPRKPVKYDMFFSSEESDDDSPKGKSTNKKRTLSPPRCISSQVNSEASVDCLSIKRKSDALVSDSNSKTDSVYNLDVSNSQNARKKKAKHKKNSQKDELPKPLFKKCSVTKAKDGNHKFSRNDNREKTSFITKRRTVVIKPCFSPTGVLEQLEPGYYSSGDEPAQVEADRTFCLDDSIAHLRQLDKLQTPKSGVRRVSFAPTDLVCNFNKTAKSQKIAVNKKVRRVSKSFIDFSQLHGDTPPRREFLEDADDCLESPSYDKKDAKELFNFSDETEMYTFTVSAPLPTVLPQPTVSVVSNPGNAAGGDDEQALPEAKNQNGQERFNFSEETELYTFSFPATVQNPILTKSNAPSQPNVVSVVSQPKCTSSGAVEESSHPAIDTLLTSVADQPKNNVFTKPKSKKFSGKLSLKRNKKSQAVPSDKTTEETIPFPVESPMPDAKPVKRKNLFKDICEDNSKENLTLENPVNVLEIEQPASKKPSLSAQKESGKKSSHRTRVNSKLSLKKGKLSDKPKSLQPTPEMKSKISTLGTKSAENSPVLKDVQNLPDVENIILPKRRSRTVNYKEPSLGTKLRRER